MRPSGSWRLGRVTQRLAAAATRADVVSRGLVAALDLDRLPDPAAVSHTRQNPSPSAPPDWSPSLGPSPYFVLPGRHSSAASRPRPAGHDCVPQFASSTHHRHSIRGPSAGEAEHEHSGSLHHQPGPRPAKPGSLHSLAGSAWSRSRPGQRLHHRGASSTGHKSLAPCVEYCVPSQSSTSLFTCLIGQVPLQEVKACHSLVMQLGKLFYTGLSRACAGIQGVPQPCHATREALLYLTLETRNSSPCTE